MFDFCFFFKQKTAYEMRISDWSSDVCSSDLPVDRGAARELRRILETPKIGNVDILARGKVENDEFVELRIDIAKAEARAEIAAEHRLRLNLRAPDAGAADIVDKRSEEHTSELQSLMRISYAVFCLKKKKKHTKQ